MRARDEDEAELDAHGDGLLGMNNMESEEEDSSERNNDATAHLSSLPLTQQELELAMAGVSSKTVARPNNLMDNLDDNTSNDLIRHEPSSGSMKSAGSTGTLRRASKIWWQKGEKKDMKELLTMDDEEADAYERELSGDVGSASLGELPSSSSSTAVSAQQKKISKENTSGGSPRPRKLNPIAVQHLKKLLKLSTINSIAGIVFFLPFMAILFFTSTVKGDGKETSSTALIGGVGLGYSMTLCFCLLIGMGCSNALDVFVGQASAQIDPVLYLNRARVCNFCVGLCCYFILLNTELILICLGQGKDVSQIAGNFVRVLAPGVFICFEFSVLTCYCRARAEPRPLMLSVWVTFKWTMVLSFLLICEHEKDGELRLAQKNAKTRGTLVNTLLDPFGRVDFDRVEEVVGLCVLMNFCVRVVAQHLACFAVRREFGAHRILVGNYDSFLSQDSVGLNQSYQSLLSRTQQGSSEVRTERDRNLKAAVSFADRVTFDIGNSDSEEEENLPVRRQITAHENIQTVFDRKGLKEFMYQTLACAFQFWLEFASTEIQVLFAGMLGGIALAAQVAAQQLCTLFLMVVSIW